MRASWTGCAGTIRLVDALPAEAARQGAGLLLMGAYGQSGVREFVFGGFTHRAPSAPPLPNLLTH